MDILQISSIFLFVVVCFHVKRHSAAHRSICTCISSLYRNQTFTNYNNSLTITHSYTHDGLLEISDLMQNYIVHFFTCFGRSTDPVIYGFAGFAYILQIRRNRNNQPVHRMYAYYYCKCAWVLLS